MILYLKERLERFEQFVAEVIYDRKKGGLIDLFATFLSGLSFIFGLLTRFRYWLYKSRIFRSRSLGCLVVVVGNLTVGGTGKTPIVEKFARSLTARGRKVAILSRGYKGKKVSIYKRIWRGITHAPVPPPKVVSDGSCVLLDSEIAGDEPYMLAKNLPGVVVLVDKDRVKAGRYAIEVFGVDTLILDDGFQYLRLKGRLNLLLIDKTNPFGNGRALPRGILREPIKHLKRASYIFLTKSDGQPDLELEETIRKHHPSVEIIECNHEPQYLESVETGEKLKLSKLRGLRVAAFSAIASPEGFENSLRGYGGELLFAKRFLDHHRFSHDELYEFFKKARAQNVDMIITTEKDAVRVPADMVTTVPLYFLRLEINILKGGSDFEKAVSDVCFPKNKMRATRLASV